MPDIPSRLNEAIGKAKAAETGESSDAAALTEQGQIKRHKLAAGERQEGIRERVHTLVCVLIYLIGGIFIVAILFRAWHMLVPQACWLDDKHLHDIDKFVISGFVGGFFSRYVGRAFGTDELGEPSDDN